MSGTDGSRDVPLFVSVVGHSDIKDEDVPKIERKLDSLFDDLARFENTRIYLMTAMTIGSEMIAVRAARRRGIGIAPVLPADIETYKALSSGMKGYEAYCEEFDSVISSEDTLGPVYIKTSSGVEDRNSFRNLSTFLIKNSHVMIAIWDGRPYSRSGGTFDTLRMAYSGIDVHLRKSYRENVRTRNDAEIKINYLDTAEDCLLYWIKAERDLDEKGLLCKGCKDLKPCEADGGYIVPRTLYDGNSKEPFTEIKTERLSFRVQEDLPGVYRKIIGRMDAMNKEIVSGSTDGEVCELCRNLSSQSNTEVYDGVFGKKKKLKEYEEPDVPTVVRQKMEYSGAFLALAKRYQAVDSLACCYQKKSFDRIHLLGLLTVLSTAFFSLFILFNNSLILNILYIVVTFFSVVMSRRHKKSGIYLKFIEYRCVAETLRVEIYRGIVGLSDQSQLPSYAYMKNDFVWIRFVLKAWCSEFMNEYDKDTAAMGTLKDRIDFVNDNWVEGQVAYHKNKRNRNGEKYGKSANEQKYLYYITMGLSILAIVVTYTEFSSTSLLNYPSLDIFGTTLFNGSNVYLETVIKLLMIFFVALSAYKLSEFSTVHGGTPDQITAKLRMFEIAQLRLVDAEKDPRLRNEGGDLKAASIILYELGEQAINENNDWAFEHKTKDFKPKQNIELRNLSKR